MTPLYSVSLILRRNQLLPISALAQGSQAFWLILVQKFL